MRDTGVFLVPDYYPYFHCKMGSCRHACCNGWPVSITLKDYFHLVGVSCSPELRLRLDRALHILPHPCDEEYAEISPKYDGTCPIRLDDGRCGLQAELGEDALAQVCRLYPRGIRIKDGPECSCANSCEAVPELFLKHTEPIRFISLPLNIDLPMAEKCENYFETCGREQEIRLYYIAVMQDRSRKIPDRLMGLGIAMQEMESVVRAKDSVRIDRLLSNGLQPYRGPDQKPSQKMLDEGMRIAGAMLEQVDAHSQSVRTYGEEILRWFAGGENSIARYDQAVSNFETILPEWETVFEHLIVNHMFFEQFPFQDRPVPVADEFLALCAVYTLLRFLSVGWLVLHPTEEDFVDVCSALFRLIQHTAFDSFAASLLRQLDFCSPEQIYNLIRL